VGRFKSDFYSQCSNVLPNNYWYNYSNPQSRKNAIEMFDSIPSGTMVVVMNLGNSVSRFDGITTWQNDTVSLGTNISLYHKLKSVGFTKVDSLTRKLPFLFIVKKNVDGFWEVIDQQVGSIQSTVLRSSHELQVYGRSGGISSSKIGPVKKWSRLKIKNFSKEGISTDKIQTSVIGFNKNSNEVLLFNSNSFTIDTSLLFIDPSIYPYLKITQNFIDTILNTPAQIDYLSVEFNPVPEGAIVPTAIISIKDTVETGEKIKLSTGFRNISDAAFDSIKVVMTVTDETNQAKVVFDQLRRPIPVGDSIVVDYLLDTKDLKGASTVFVNFNPEFAQPEQYLFNNYQTTSLSVTPDRTPPNLDVTFDGVRILNKDIVSAKPFIVISLKDDSRFLALNDTSLFIIKLRMPDGNLKNIRFDGDTLQFIPATLDGAGKENAAAVHYRPHFTQDGEYELIVFAKDRSNNASGAIDYSVAFEVVNKSMISNLLNYPNPFTTSTAFVFTLTGSELPTQFRIQILTITGKIVKEINKDELGPIRIGNNITEYKWDGRDQYGQPLANGVYLYRVNAEINGKSIEKLSREGMNTDKYFKSGYGKMYLMR
jgi:hypothetical protein